MLAEAAESALRRIDLGEQRARIGDVGRSEPCLESSLCGVERTTLRLVRARTSLVRDSGRRLLSGSRRELCLEAEQLCSRRSTHGFLRIGGLALQPLDRRARSLCATEVKIQVREVERCLLDGRDASSALAEIDRGLEVLEREREVSFRARDPGQIQPHRRNG